MQEPDFQQIAETQQAKERQLNADDLQHELGGQDTGRIKRHLPNEPSVTMQQEKERKKQTQAMLTLAMILATDPEYAALYRDTMDMITRAEIATENALQLAEQRLATAQQDLSDMLENANRLPPPDGRAIFKDERGDVWTADGEKVDDPVLLAGVVWKDGAASREDHLAKTQTIATEHHNIGELRQYQIDVLGDAREQMTDENNPASRDKIDVIRERMTEHAPDVIAKDIAAPDIQSVADYTAPTNMQSPSF